MDAAAALPAWGPPSIVAVSVKTYVAPAASGRSGSPTTSVASAEPPSSDAATTELGTA